MYAQGILCRISKCAFEIPYKISHPHIVRFDFYTLKFKELLDLRTHKHKYCQLAKLTHPPWVTIQSPSRFTTKSARIFPMSSAQSGTDLASQYLARQPQNACRVTIRPQFTWSSSNIWSAMLRTKCNWLRSLISNVRTRPCIISGRSRMVSSTKLLMMVQIWLGGEQYSSPRLT